MKSLQRIVTGVTCLLSFLTAQADTITLSSTGTGLNWSDNNIWTPTTYPNATGLIIEKYTASSATVNQNVTGGVIVGGFRSIGSSANTLILTVSNNVTLSNGALPAEITIDSTNIGARFQFNAGGGSLVLGGDLAITNASYATASTAGAMVFSAPISGTGNITVSNSSNTLNAGHIRLEATNTFTGNFSLTKGIVTFNNAASFGNSSNLITLGSARDSSEDPARSASLLSILQGNSAITVANAIHVVAGSGGTLSLGASPTATGSPTTTFSGNILLDDTVNLVTTNLGTAASNVTTNYTGVITGDGGIVVNGTNAGTGKIMTQVRGANTFTGETRVASGVLAIGALSLGSQSLALQNSTVNLAASDTGTLQFGTSNTDTITSAVFGGLTGSRNLVLHNVKSTPDAVALSVGKNNQSTQYDGVLSGAGSLNKIGSGELTLTAAQIYTGSTTITGGALKLGSGASLAANSNVMVGTDGRLTGTGAALGHVSIAGTIAPGNSPGAMTLGSATLEGGGRYVLDLASNGTTGSAGTDWDQLVVNGALDLTSLSSANRFVIDLTSYSSLLSLGAIAGFDEASSYTWTSVITFDSLNGTFSNDLFSFETANFANAHTGTFSFELQDNALNLVYAAAIPEPSTYAAIVGGLALLAVGCFRRLRQA